MSTEWPDQVPAIFMGGILDGRELMVPANDLVFRSYAAAAAQARA
jgi:hypothetical protein